MLKEERELRDTVRPYLYEKEVRPVFALITALVKSVREDCAKVADGWPDSVKHIKKPRNIVSMDIAAAIRGRK